MGGPSTPDGGSGGNGFKPRHRFLDRAIVGRCSRRDDARRQTSTVDRGDAVPDLDASLPRRACSCQGEHGGQAVAKPECGNLRRPVAGHILFGIVQADAKRALLVRADVRARRGELPGDVGDSLIGRL